MKNKNAVKHQSTMPFILQMKDNAGLGENEIGRWLGVAH